MTMKMLSITSVLFFAYLPIAISQLPDSEELADRIEQAAKEAKDVRWRPTETPYPQEIRTVDGKLYNTRRSMRWINVSGRILAHQGLGEKNAVLCQRVKFHEMVKVQGREIDICCDDSLKPFKGRVIQCIGRDYLVEATSPLESTLWLVGGPGGHVDGDLISVMAVFAGTTNYTTVLGADKRVRLYAAGRGATWREEVLNEVFCLRNIDSARPVGDFELERRVLRVGEQSWSTTNVVIYDLGLPYAPPTRSKNGKS